MLRFDCMGAKGQAREWIRSVKPSPMLVTLIFLVLTTALLLGQNFTSPINLCLLLISVVNNASRFYWHPFS